MTKALDYDLTPKDSATVSLTIPKRMILSANRSETRQSLARKRKTLRTWINGEVEHLDTHAFDFFNVTVHIYPLTNHRIDPINFAPTIKPLVDGLTDCGWWVDDDWQHLDATTFRYGGHKCPTPGCYMIELKIQEIPRVRSP